MGQKVDKSEDFKSRDFHSQLDSAIKGFKLEESIKRSKKQSDVNNTILILAQNGQWLENKNLKSFYFYYLMDLGILLPDRGPNNIINRQRAMEYLEFLGNHNKQRVKEVVEICDPGTNVTPSDRPLQFCKCLQQHGMPIDVLKKT